MYCVLTAGDDNADANPNNIIFTIKDTKLYVPVVNLSARDNKKLSKLFGRVFKGSVYLNEYRTNSENKNTTNDCRCFLKSNFVGVNRLFVLGYSNQNANFKRFKTQQYYLPKRIIGNYNVIINEKKLYDQPIDSDIKRYEYIRKLTRAQGGHYTTGCLLDYDYIKNHNRLTIKRIRC